MSNFLCDIIKLYFRISSYNTLVTSFLKNKLVGKEKERRQRMKITIVIIVLLYTVIF